VLALNLISLRPLGRLVPSAAALRMSREGILLWPLAAKLNIKKKKYNLSYLFIFSSGNEGAGLCNMLYSDTLSHVT